MYNAADARAGGGAHGDHIAAATDRDGRVARPVGGIEAGEHGLELLDQALAGLTHRPAGAREAAGRSVPDLPRGIKRFGQTPLKLPGRRIDPQCCRPRCIGREPRQIGGRQARRGEGLADERQGRALERAARHGEQVECGGDVGDGLGPDCVVPQHQGGKLRHLRERAADRVGIDHRHSLAHAGRAERTDRMRRHPLQRGRKLQGLEDGGCDPDAHTVAANSSRTI